MCSWTSSSGGVDEAAGLRDEIEMRGRVKKSDVEAAQKEVVAIAKRLIAQGDIIMGEGDEDYV